MVDNSLIQQIEPHVNTYLAYFVARPDGSEIEYRYCLEDLFSDMQLPFMDKTSIIQEDSKSGLEIDGMPDFFVWDDADKIFKSLIGFIECKKPAYNLDKLIESEQIKKYSKTCENIIITNYKRFILLQKGKKQHDITLSHDTKTLLDFITLLQDFYSCTYPYIRTKKTLASSLAAQSFYYSVELRKYIANTKNSHQNFYIKFNGLFKEYEKSINYSYQLADFCDIYSQSLVYGLLLARLDTNENLDEKELNYIQKIPDDYKLLKEFLSQAYQNWDLPTEIKMALTNIGKNINLIDTEAIIKEFLKTNDGKQNVAVYLYEDFLAQYDKFRGTENRKEGGVYYTPQEATDFITRGVNYLLKTCFDLPDGYNSENVKILDFACGTGTFLHSIFDLMIPQKPDTLAKQAIKNKITKDIYGFELLFTPYIIAHTVLTRFLKEKGIELDNERLGIYLTNTLDISSHSISEFLPELKREYEKSQRIKDVEDILAIVGNPPYFNGKSNAKTDVIDYEIQKYKQGLNEKKINLDDLYIKFIRFAEWKIQKNGYGVVGIITNNSYLDGVTHRQMRKHLHKTFDEIYIVNLHGNSRKGEYDKNIFDIMVGVSIVFFVKHKKPLQKKTVKYFSTSENNLVKRQEKLDFLENSKFSKLKWKELHPQKDEYFWFVEKDISHKKEYERFWKVTEIFSNAGSGIKTDRDELVIDYSKNELIKKMQTALNTDFYFLTPEFREKYRIKNSSGYAFVDRIKKEVFDKKKIRITHYRPFDYRNIYYSIGFTSRPAENLTKHFENENIGICFSRTTNGNIYRTIFVSKHPIDGGCLGDWTYFAPLYIYNGGNGYAEIDFDGHKRYANFTPNFIKKYIEKNNFKPTPEEILAYIYAVLHSKIYREKYVEFLKTDFPAVPLTKNKETFYKYAKLGQNLIDLHLLRRDALQCVSINDEISVNYNFSGDFVVEKISHDNNKLFLFTTDNKTVTIEGITPQTYNFEIGSYRPVEKWLKYRIKDKVPLTISDLNHLKNMILAIKNTILVMRKIEELGEEYLALLI